MGRECIGFRVRMLNRMVTAIYDETLSEAGLKTSQFNLLVAVTNREESRPAELAKILEMDESTLSRNVERMRAKGWLEVVPGEDARTQPFRLTAQGKRLLERAVPAWEKAQSQATEFLGDDGIALLSKAASKLGMPEAKP